MKKLIISLMFCLAVISSQAQLKIFSGGNVSLGSTSAPASGKLHVRGNSAGTLSSGIYSYSLLADGKLVDTKKMVKD